jgi:hypothetical protein
VIGSCAASVCLHVERRQRDRHPQPTCGVSRLLAAAVKLTVVAGENLTGRQPGRLPAVSVAPGR